MDYARPTSALWCHWGATEAPGCPSTNTGSYSDRRQNDCHRRLRRSQSFMLFLHRWQFRRRRRRPLLILRVHCMADTSSGLTSTGQLWGLSALPHLSVHLWGWLTLTPCHLSTMKYTWQFLITWLLARTSLQDRLDSLSETEIVPILDLFQQFPRWS